MLEASNLECVRGERRLFADVGFRLAGGEMLYVQGSNGSGKTSLLRMLCALTPAASGEIRWRGGRIGKLGEEFRLNHATIKMAYGHLLKSKDIAKDTLLAASYINSLLKKQLIETMEKR